MLLEITLIVVAWAPTGDSLRPRPSESQGIVGGKPVPPGRWDAVVGFVVGEHFCSGVAISETLVMTAGHCLRDIEAELLGDGLVFFGTDARDPAAVVGVASYGIFPEFCSECFYERHDLAYLELERAVTLSSGFPSFIVDQPTWDTVMRPGRPIDMVGYGQAVDGEPTATDDLGIGIKREVAGTLAWHGESGFDFKAGGDGRGTCNGDSGGPALVPLSDGGFAVAGILTGGLGGCGNSGVFNVPYPALAWLRDETGQDFLPAECQAADCLETAVPGDGCGCHSHRSGPVGVMFVLFGLAWGRPRRVAPRAR